MRARKRTTTHATATSHQHKRLIKMNFEHLLDNIVETHQALYAKAVQTINQTLTLRNWCTGAYIVEYEQAGKDRAVYGSELLAKLAEALKARNIKGLPVQELRKCRQVYKAYPLLLQVILLQENLPLVLLDFAVKIRGTVSRELQITDNEDIIKRYLLIFQKLSYSHLIELSKIESEIARQYYELIALKTTLSVRELRRQIASLAYERTGLSKDVQASFAQIEKTIQPQNPADAIKDLYVFEFLGLSAQHTVSEDDLESALLEHLQAFILELGNGFCFEARQKHILIGDEYFFIDLVFYHRIFEMSCIVGTENRQNARGAYRTTQNIPKLL
jgi:predicted nuclease of restriction endonuclease-like (RecB) superfamily